MIGKNGRETTRAWIPTTGSMRYTVHGAVVRPGEDAGDELVRARSIDVADDTSLAHATVDALRATAVPGGAIDDVNVFALQLQAIPGNGYQDDAMSVTANLNMWPHPLVIVISADTYDASTSAQKAVLSQAAIEAADNATAASKAEDEEALSWICPSPMEIIQMTDAELDVLGSLFEPVYADLRQDPVVAAELDAIRTFKPSIDATPDTFTCEYPPQRVRMVEPAHSPSTDAGVRSLGRPIRLVIQVLSVTEFVTLVRRP